MSEFEKLIERLQAATARILKEYREADDLLGQKWLKDEIDKTEYFAERAATREAMTRKLEAANRDFELASLNILPTVGNA